MKQKFELKNLGIKDKLLDALKQKLWKEQVEEVIIQKSRKTFLAMFLTDKKVVIFESDNETFGNAVSYQYGQIKKIWKANETRTKCDLYVDLFDNKLVSFEYQNVSSVDEFMVFFNTKHKAVPASNKINKDYILNKIEKSHQLSKDEMKNIKTNRIDLNQVIKSNPNPEISINTSTQTKNHLPRLYVEKPQYFAPEKPIQEVHHPLINHNLINDKVTKHDGTFSSQYISDLLSRKNTLLPNGSLTLIEKLENKLNAIELTLSNPNVRLDFSQAVELGIEVSNLKKRIYELELVNYEDEILNVKMYVKREVDNFVDRFGTQMKEIDRELKANQGSSNIFNKINEVKNIVAMEIEKVRNIASDDRKFLEKTASHQKNMQVELEKMKQKIADNKQQIFISQKAWMDTKEKINAQLEKSDGAEFNNDLLNEIDMKINALASNINFKDAFKNTSFNVNNKILAIDDKGRGAYFNIENFKEDIIDIIKRNETVIYNSIEEKMDQVKSISEEVFDTTSKRFETIKNWYEEIKDFKNSTEQLKQEQTKQVAIAPPVVETPNKQKIFHFKALSYSYNGEIRYGIRSGMKWSIEDSNDGRRGINSLYVDKNGKQLKLFDYDGIIFNNNKYYFNMPSEFDDTFTPNCKFQVVKFENTMMISKIFNFEITKKSFIYTAMNENSEILNDQSEKPALYDLKWLTFFKD